MCHPRHLKHQPGKISNRMRNQDIRGEEPLLWFEKTVPVSQQILTSLYETLPPTAYTDRLLAFFQAMSGKHPEIDLLPLRIYGQKTQSVESAVPLMLAWQLLRFSAKMFDDAEDEPDHRPEWINLGTGFLFTAQQILLDFQRSGFSQERVEKIHRQFNMAALRACSGQHFDLLAQVQTEWIDPDTWLEIALAKSGEIFAWSTWAGAVLAGFDDEISVEYRKFGYHLGALLQTADDYNDIWGAAEPGGVFSFHNNLPLIYGYFVASPEQRPMLEDSIQAIQSGDIKAMEFVRSYLIQSGAQKYILAVGWLQKQKAVAALSNAKPTAESQGHLHQLLNNFFPVLP